jgi:hypothetical protein
MRLLNIFKIFGFILFISLNLFAQSSPVTIDLVSEDDTIPGVLKALPDYEKVKDKATHIQNTAELKKALGERNVFDLIDFTGGNDAATANYDSGKVLIVEFAAPQVSFEADNQIKQRLSESQSNPPVYYRRIGNYNAFVFEGKSEESANALLNQIKYQKSVKWLATDPFYDNRAERYFVGTASQIFLGTFIAIGTLLATMIGLGLIAGFIYYRISNRQRESMTAFSDAGGMVRLNLDELTPEVSAND